MVPTPDDEIRNEALKERATPVHGQIGIVVIVLELYEGHSDAKQAHE